MGAIVLFSDGQTDRAAVYLHGDDGDVPDRLIEFFTQEDSYITSDQRYGQRFDDAEYLAARFVADQLTADGTGVGIVPPGDRSDLNYRVLCTQETWPRVATLDD